MYDYSSKIPLSFSNEQLEGKYKFCYERARFCKNTTVHLGTERDTKNRLGHKIRNQVLSSSVGDVDKY